MKISQLIILLLCVVGLNAQNTNTTPPVSNVKDTAINPMNGIKKSPCEDTHKLGLIDYWKQIPILKTSRATNPGATKVAVSFGGPE